MFAITNVIASYNERYNRYRGHVDNGVLLIIGVSPNQVSLINDKLS